jgi:uncharacterized cupredoxin-like copper-binding protein
MSTEMRRRTMTETTIFAAGAALFAIASFGIGIGFPGPGRAHEGHGTFSAGEPGDPNKPARTIRVVMYDDGSEKDMRFEPALITVRKGEQIRFFLENGGTESHEFMLATVAENRKHGELMKKFPEMKHDDLNAKRLTVGQQGELVWKFTNAGEFEFACLIPGHYEAGMHGKIIVK